MLPTFYKSDSTRIVKKHREKPNNYIGPVGTVVAFYRNIIAGYLHTNPLAYATSVRKFHLHFIPSLLLASTYQRVEKYLASVALKVRLEVFTSSIEKCG